MEKVNPFQRFITIIPSPLMGEGGGGGEKSPSPNLVPEADPPWQASHQGLLSSCGATEGQGRGELNPTESDRELFQRVCTLCHGWAVENFLVAEGMVEGMEPICPPPFANWLPVVLTVATYQVKVQDKEETLPLIPRRDVLRVVEYLNENYPKEPICAKPWKKDIK